MRTPSANQRPFAVLLLGLLACALWLPLRGQVVYSTFDMHSYSVPELELHLHGNHGFGPALWDPHNGLGRPALQTGGLTPASWPCFLASFGFDDAWQLHSVLVLGLLVLGGLFAHGLFRALELAPWPSAACALGFAYSSFHAGAGAQILCLGGSVWTMGLLWVLVANLRRPSPGRGLLLALAVHSALLAAYPQQLVWAGWLGLCVGLAILPPRGERLRRLAHLALFAGIGVACSAPFLLDLLEKAAASRRELTIPRVPDPRGLREWLAYLCELGDPLWNGRLELWGETHRLWGVASTTFFGPALLLALARVRTRLTGLVAGYVAVTLLVTLCEPAYRFGTRYLGLGFSHFHPFAASNAPIFLLAALGLDHAWRTPGVPSRAALALVLPVLSAIGASLSPRPLVPSHVALSLALALCAAAVLAWRSLPALVLGALGAAAIYGVAGLPARPRAVVERIVRYHDETAEAFRAVAQDGRIALVGSRWPPWPNSNVEILYGLTSIHCYDALPPEPFKAWVRRISAAGMINRERVFSHLTGTAGLASEDFARAGVRLVASYEGLDSPLLRLAGARRNLSWYEVLDPGPLQAWVPRAACRVEGREASIPAPLAALAAPVERRPGLDERFELAFEPSSEPGLLWLSQQHHRHWHARAQGQPLETVRVDGIWQGVLVPAGVGRVTLEFRPWIRWWWVPQLFFALAGLAWLAGRRARRRPRVPGAPA